MITIEPLNQATAPAYVQLHNQIFGATLTPEDLASGDARAVKARLFRARWIAFKDGHPCGLSALLGSPYNPGNEFDIEIAVAGEKRRQGIGGALFTHVIKRAEENGAAAIRCSVRDDNAGAVEWLEKRGGQRILHRCESELDVSAFNAEKHRERTSRLFGMGFTVRSMLDFANDGGWDRYHRLFLALLRDAPDMAGLPDWSLDHARSALRENRNSKPEWQLLAIDGGGEWQGMSVLSRLGQRGYIFFTGVRPETRHRGIAEVLQGEAVLRAEAHGLSRVFINNLSVNQPMVALNRRLGFQAKPGFWVVRIVLKPGNRE